MISVKVAESYDMPSVMCEEVSLTMALVQGIVPGVQPAWLLELLCLAMGSPHLQDFSPVK